MKGKKGLIVGNSQSRSGPINSWQRQNIHLYLLFRKKASIVGKVKQIEYTGTYFWRKIGVK